MKDDATTTITVRVGRLSRGRLLGIVATVVLVVAGVWVAARDSEDETAASSSTTSEGSSSRETTTTVPEVVDTATLQVRSAISSPAGVSIVASDGELYSVRAFPAAVAFANGDGVVVAQDQDPFDGNHYPPTPAGPIRVLSGSDVAEITGSDGEALRLLDIGEVNDDEPVALATARSGTSPDDTDERLLLIDLSTGERTDLGSVGGWESGVHEGRLLEDSIVTLFTAGAQHFVQVRTLDGTIQYQSHEPVIDRNVHLAASGDTALLIEPKPLEKVLLVTRINLTDGDEVGTGWLDLQPVGGMTLLDGFCLTPDWNGAELLCDQSNGPPLAIDLTSGVTKPIAGVTQGIARYPRPGSNGSPAASSAPAGPNSCPAKSGSSPATFDPDQGTYAAHVTDFADDASTIAFDVVQWLSGQNAIDAYHADYPDDPEGPPNDYYIVNRSDHVRTAPINPDATVWLVRLAQTGNAGLKAGSVAELHAYLAQDFDTTVYWLTFSDGFVTELCEQYQP